MERIRIGDACEILNGYAFKSDKYVADGIRVIRIANVQKGYIEDSTPAFYPLDSAGLEKYMLEEGDLLMSLTGNVGRVAMLEKQFLPAALNQRVACLRLKTDRISKGYLFHILNSDYFEQQCIQSSKGVAQKNMSTEWLKDYEIPLYSKEEQAIIERILDKVRAITSARQQEFRTLDGLIKARFVEMFGDPVANDMGWDTLPLENVCKAIVDCPHSTPSYTNEDTGFMCIRTSIVKKNKILWDDIEYISEDEFAKRIQRKKPEVGDIVYTREGAILGIAAIIDRDCNVALGQRSMLLSPDIYKCTSEFLCVAMNSDSFLDNALRGVSGSASPHINVGDIKAFKMIMPPIELQEQFSDFVKQVDKSKVVELIVKNMSLLLHSGLDILIIREVMR